jgi:hypothetical protein
MNESLRNRPHCKKRAVTSQSNIVDTSSSQLPPQPLILKDTTPDDNDNRKMLKKKNKKQKKKRSRSVVRFSPKKKNLIYLADDYDRKPIELDVYECDQCSIKIIFGERYHCKEYDYDLCHECGKIKIQTTTKTKTETETKTTKAHEHEHSNWEIIPPDDDDFDEDNDDKNNNNVGVDSPTAGISLKTPSCS